MYIPYIYYVYPIYTYVYISIYIYAVISPTQYVPWLSDFSDFRQKGGDYYQSFS